MKLPMLLACLGLTVLSVSPAQAQKTRHRRDVISAEEIATRPGDNNAYDLIRALRPAWFNTRGVASGQVSTDALGGITDNAGIAVYVDGARRGGVDQLETIEADRIQEMRRLSASDATQKYGTGHTQGAIEVTTKH